MHDALSGLLIASVGGLYLWKSVTELDIGTPFNMGAGYLPMLISFGLVLVGAVISFNSTKGTPQTEKFANLPWRAIVCVFAAMLAFALLLHQAGLFPTVAVVSILAGLASSQRLIQRISVAIGVALFCTIIFYFVIGLPVTVIGNWRF